MLATDTLTGEKVILRPVLEDDIVTFAQWMSDPEVTHHTLMRTFTLAEEYAWLAQIAGEPDELLFCICIKESEKPIGTCSIHHLQNETETGVGIMIGDKAEWGKGYGTDAMKLLVGFARDQLKVKRVWLRVDTENMRAQKAYEKAGFGIIKRNKNPERVNSNGEEYEMEIRF